MFVAALVAALVAAFGDRIRLSWGRGEAHLNSSQQSQQQSQELEPRECARQFLQDELRSGPLLASRVEKHAHRLGINGPDLETARESLGVVASRANSGKAGGHAVIYSLPG
jgi:hypothetical protein